MASFQDLHKPLANRIRLGDISLVIPVKDNQTGVNRLLKTFFETHKAENYPAEIIIVDNNSEEPVTVANEYQGYRLDIQLLQCAKPGPASARNLGAKHAKGKWLLFVDSDCIPTESMITGYLIEADSSIVGFQGYVGALGADYISRYYKSQQIHQPPYKIDDIGKKVPKYLVTANILVQKEVFESIHGFDESYSFAGEDVDFGSRLSSIGGLAYAPKSKVLHNFDDGFWGLIIRFVKYGKGNRLVQKKLKLPLYPFPFTPKDKTIWVNYFLALIQWLCLLLGYTIKSFELLIKGKLKNKELGLS